VLSQRVPARLNVWGQPQTRENLPLGLSAVAPFSVSTPKNDPVTAALLASGAHVNMPSPTIAGVKLTPEQSRAYQIAIGKEAYPAVASTVLSPDWATMNKDQQHDAVSGAMRQVRQDARDALGFNWSRAANDATPLPPGFQVMPPGFVVQPAPAPKAKAKIGMFAAGR
jgi:hypothetical protein